jgi:hypothetical protein
MHQAPKVHWPAPRLRLQAFVLLALWLAGLASGGLWWRQSGASDTALWYLVLANLASGVAALADWMRTIPGDLVWDGEAWAWTSVGQSAESGSLTVSIAFQRVMLLHFRRTSGDAHWVWVARTDKTTSWRAFRRAVFASQQVGSAGNSKWGTSRSVDVGMH